MKLREVLYLLGLRPNPRTYSHEIVTFTLPADGEIQYAQWLHPGESKKEIRQGSVDELRKFVRPGDVVIDIGAHTGDSTIPLALAAGPGGCVLALEPNPFVFPVLKKNAELNAGKASIVPLMIAAIAESGNVSFHYSDSGFCNGGSHPGISRWRHGHAFELTVRGENLPRYVAAHFPELASRIRFVKVDAEGYDYDVIVSLRDLIARQKPFIKAEVFKLLNLERRERLFDLLVGLGYDVFVVEGDRLKGPRLERRQLMDRRHFDVFCVPTPA